VRFYPGAKARASANDGIGECAAGGEVMNMRSEFGQVQERALVHNGTNGVAPAAVPPTVREIPYDYVSTFTLLGKRGNRVPDVINISTDGAFVASAIGYSFIPGLDRNLVVTAQGSGATFVDSWKVVGGHEIKIPPDALEGLDIDFLLSKTGSGTEQLAIVNPVALLQCLLVERCGIHFKYSVVDSGSGRELQNLPIHNIAGLGKSDGERPFRPFTKPMLFMPRSTIRIEVEEVSEGLLYKDAQLFIVLHGYKMLGYGTGLP
jgi:hypothetical protein